MKKKLKEVLKIYDLELSNNRIMGKTSKSYKYITLAYINDCFIERIKNNDLHNGYPSAARMMITILHPYFNEIFGNKYTYNEIVDCLHKLKLNVEDGCVMIEDCEDCVKYETIAVDDLLEFLNDSKSGATTVEDLLVQLIKSHIEK